MLRVFYRFAVALLISLVVGSCAVPAVLADSTDNPQSTAVGLEGTVSTAPPTRGATITTPGNGQTFTAIPVTVAGLCPAGLLVKLFSNNVFVGSTNCTTGSYTLQIDLFSGRNDLVARVYDALDQAGPDSNTVSVTFNDAQFAQFGTRVTLSSVYARRGANPGSELDWPVIISGGVGPYALSADWGDGKPPSLQSEPNAGTVTIKHTYATAGIYKVVVRATDKNGTSAYLQLVAVANGQVSQVASTKGGSTTILTRILWWPALLLIPFIVLAFWLGGRHELYALRRSLEKNLEKS